MSHSRREFLAMIGGGAALAPFAQNPAAPRNLHVVTGKAVLRPTDLTYLGVLQFPNDGLNYGGTSMTLRRSGGALTLIVLGGDGASEFSIPAPDQKTYRQIQSAPVLTLSRRWNDITGGRMVTAGGNAHIGQLWWDETTQQLWWSYGDSYATSWDPSLGFCTLDNPATGAITAYGPWRCQNHSQLTREFFLTIPSAFAAAHCPGSRFAIGSGPYSGSAAAWGANAFASVAPTKTTPPDSISTDPNPHTTVRQTSLVFFPKNASQPRPTDANARAVKFCNWRYGPCPATMAQFQGLVDIIPDRWGPTGVDGTDVLMDSFNAACWIDTPTKQGAIYFGHLVAHVPGYSDYGGYGTDPNFCHVWYEDCGVCPHGQNADASEANGIWLSTGPAATTMPPYFAIFDTNDFARVADGKLSPSGIRPTTFQPLSTIMTAWPKVQGNLQGFGGAAFDAATGLLYVLQRNVYFHIALNQWLAGVHVFRVNS